MRHNSLTLCGRLARQQDRDRFTISLLLPLGYRANLWPLLAFNAEIAKTIEVAADPTIGLIRLQWWRDEIQKLHEPGSIPAHPVLDELAPVVTRHGLPLSLFESLIDAREPDVRREHPSTLAGLSAYAQTTATPLFKLAVMTNGADPDHPSVQNTAAAYALAGLLRAAAWRAGHGFPVLYGSLKPEALPGAAQQIAEHATSLLTGIRPRDIFITFAAQAARIHLKRIKSLKYNVFHPLLASPPLFYPLRIMAEAKTGNLSEKI